MQQLLEIEVNILRLILPTKVVIEIQILCTVKYMNTLYSKIYMNTLHSKIYDYIALEQNALMLFINVNLGAYIIHIKVILSGPHALFASIIGH